MRAGVGGTFSYFELGEPMQREALLSGRKLPSWEKLASYVFFTATGEGFVPGKAVEARYLAGKGSTLDVYLLYSNDIDELKDMVLTKSFAQKLARGRRAKVVFAPTKYVNADFLRANRIAFQQLPFEIYERVEKLSR